MAGGKSQGFSQALLNLIFQATTIANLAENASASPLTNLYVSLHTSSPGATGNQTTNEAAYTSYARQAVVRTSSGFSAGSTGAMNLVSNLNFPTATGGGETETYFAIGTASSGTGVLLWFGPLSSNIVVTSGVTPELTTTTQVTEA